MEKSFILDSVFVYLGVDDVAAVTQGVSAEWKQHCPTAGNIALPQRPQALKKLYISLTHSLTHTLSLSCMCVCVCV